MSKPSLFKYAELAKGGSASHQEALVELTNETFLLRPPMVSRLYAAPDIRGLLVSARGRVVRIHSNCAGETSDTWQRITLPIHLWGHLLHILHTSGAPLDRDGWLDKDSYHLAAIVRYQVARRPRSFGYSTQHARDCIVLPHAPEEMDEIYMLGGHSDPGGGIYVTTDIVDEMCRRIKELVPRILR